MEQRMDALRPHEVGGTEVALGAVTRLVLPVGRTGYANAQLDDHHAARSRRDLTWFPGTELSLRARFSHAADALVGTAGFGFWNAPFGHTAFRFPALPRAVWFFFASAPTDLPLPADGPGRGWFAATIDAQRPRALALAPLAPAVLLLNNISAIRRRLWPSVRRNLGISFQTIDVSLTDWHDYALDWQSDGCCFLVDGRPLLTTPAAPGGPLGFVCWMDNQYLVATPNGRFAAGVLATDQDQWLEIADLVIRPGALADG